jgi:hypothetical protein
MINFKDFEQTDGSDNTLQYGKFVNETTWLYREWIDLPFEVKGVLSSEEKIAAWDSNKWREEEIDISEFTIEQIKESVSCYGYTLVNVVSNVDFSLFQSNHTYDLKSSIQLACECIFELDENPY